MNLQIMQQPFSLTIHGFSATAINKEYAATAFQLSGKMWEVIKANNLKNKGMNVWVYEGNEKVFAGVELDDAEHNTALEQKEIHLDKYAYYKHIGPYSQLKQVGLNIRNELQRQGLETTFPYVEIYGHWPGDESKAETEILMRLK